MIRLIIAIALLAGCCTKTAYLSDDAVTFSGMYRQLESFEPITDEIRTRVDLEVVLCPPNDPVIKAAHKHAVGCAVGHKKQIRLYGFRFPDGQLVFSPAVLGHEVWHFLHWGNPVIPDPDNL